MTPAKAMRGCVLVYLLAASGCAHWGWKHAARQDLDEVAVKDDEARFVETAPERPLKQPAVVAKRETTPEKRSPEDEALIANTLARVREQPGVKPEQIAEVERHLRASPSLVLQQMNALANRKPEATAPTQPTPPAAAAATTPPPEAKPAAAAAPPVEKPPVVAKVTDIKPPAAPAVVEQEVANDSEAEEAEIEEEPEATPSPPRRLLDRVRRARESSGDKGEDGNIFGDRVSANDPPALDPHSLAVAHVTRKPADDVPPRHVSWQKQVSAAIAALEDQLDRGQFSQADAPRAEMQLRLLYLAAERDEDALAEIAGLDPYEQDYWRSQAHALSILLAADGTPVKGRRAAQALRPLREAIDHLASQATLDVKNIALCKSVTIWGNYTEFDKYEFAPNQEVLLYFEVENFASQETNKGFATEFVTTYEIFDASGRRAFEQQLPIAQETCQNRRRDYFIRYHLHVPKSLAPGEYTLQLTVEDQKGGKFGQGSVKFRVTS